MKGKQKIALCLVFLPLAIGLLAWWHWASQTVMRIKNYDTQHIYVEFPAKAGDRLFFGWIHSLEHIRFFVKFWGAKVSMHSWRGHALNTVRVLFRCVC